MVFFTITDRYLLWHEADNLILLQVYVRAALVCLSVLVWIICPPVLTEPLVVTQEVDLMFVRNVLLVSVVTETTVPMSTR